MLMVQKCPFLQLFFLGNIGQENVFGYCRTKKRFCRKKSHKTEIFPNGFTHGFGLKMAIFPTIFLAIEARKMCYTIFNNEKTPFQATKRRSSKSRKIQNFFKCLTDVFGQKQAILPSFVFQAIQAGKMCFTIFQNEKTPFQAIKTRS